MLMWPRDDDAGYARRRGQLYYSPKTKGPVGGPLLPGHTCIRVSIFSSIGRKPIKYIQFHSIWCEICKVTKASKFPHINPMAYQTQVPASSSGTSSVGPTSDIVFFNFSRLLSDDV